MEGLETAKEDTALVPSAPDLALAAKVIKESSVTMWGGSIEDTSNDTLATESRVSLILVKGSTQKGTLDHVVAESFSCCQKVGRQHKIKKRDKQRVNIVCAGKNVNIGCQKIVKKEGTKVGEPIHSLVEEVASSNCPYFISAKVSGAGSVRITTAVLTHSCADAAPRQRQVKRKVLVSCAPVISSFEVSKGKRGDDARQLHQQVQQQHGITLKPGQVQNILRAKKNDYQNPSPKRMKVLKGLESLRTPCCIVYEEIAGPPSPLLPLLPHKSFFSHDNNGFMHWFILPIAFLL
jgi:hypothetical protein